VLDSLLGYATLLEMKPDAHSAQTTIVSPRRTASGLPEPQIGIIVAAYNAATTLDSALGSVLAQDYANWQVVIVDDGSTDGTRAVAERWAAADSRISVVVQPNAGAAAARNAGLAAVNSEYVTYLDSDDRFADGYMSAMLRLISAYPGRDIYSSDGLFVYEDGFSRPVFGYERVLELRIEDLIDECRILGGGALIRTAALRALGGYREHLYGEDYDLWLRALASGLTHVATPETLYIYHQSVAGQKSEDRSAGAESAVTALRDLIESGLLTTEQEQQARASIDKFMVAPELDNQARRLHSLLQRMFGDRAAITIMRKVHSVSWIIRPLRRMIARFKAKSTGSGS